MPEKKRSKKNVKIVEVIVKEPSDKLSSEDSDNDEDDFELTEAEKRLVEEDFLIEEIGVLIEQKISPRDLK
jgi:hypothetical protein